MWSPVPSPPCPVRAFLQWTPFLFPFFRGIGFILCGPICPGATFSFFFSGRYDYLKTFSLSQFSLFFSFPLEVPLGDSLKPLLVLSRSLGSEFFFFPLSFFGFCPSRFGTLGDLQQGFFFLFFGVIVLWVSHFVIFPTAEALPPTSLLFFSPDPFPEFCWISCGIFPLFLNCGEPFFGGLPGHLVFFFPFFFWA